MSAPLAGIVVADFSRVLAGPLATMTLADLGARVIKIERPATGDDTRAWGPPYADSGMTTYFESANRGKESVTLDLRTEEDRQRAHAIIARSDVVIENFRPGLFARLGFDGDELIRRHPGIVYVSVSGFGLGEGANLPGYDFVAQAVGGLMHITGQRDGEAMKAGVALVDVLTGKDAVIGILAALRRREFTGKGSRIEVNLLSSPPGRSREPGVCAPGGGRRTRADGEPNIPRSHPMRCSAALMNPSRWLAETMRSSRRCARRSVRRICPAMCVSRATQTVWPIATRSWKPSRTRFPRTRRHPGRSG